jgi:predicted N-acetyltransferase YhbS
VLLGQLAVDVRYQKQGLGGALLADAVREIVAADEHVAMPLIVGDALNESIARWYAKYGSEPYVSLAVSRTYADGVMQTCKSLR